MNKVHAIVLTVVLLIVTFARPIVSNVQATPNPFPPVVQGFHLITPTEGWLWMTHLYWTYNGGQSWTDITPHNLSGAGLAGVSFIDNQHGEVFLISQTPDLPLRYAIAYTSDTGKTWTINPVTLFSAKEDNIYSGRVTSFQFLDANTGWVVIQAMSSSNFDVGTLFKTTDGGTSWKKLITPISRSGTTIGDPAYFVTDQIGWIVGRSEGWKPESNLLYRTPDGGQTWQAQTVGVLPAIPAQRTYFLPQFVNPHDGLLTVSVAQDKDSTIEIYITHDGGETWQLDSSVTNGGTAILLDNAHWIATIPDRTLVQRTNTQVGTPVPLSQDTSATHIVSATFPSVNVGLAEAVMFNSATALSTIELLYTNNGGKTWQHLMLPESSSGSVPQTVKTISNQGFDTCEAPDATTVLSYWKTHGEDNTPNTAYVLLVFLRAMSDNGCQHS